MSDCSSPSVLVFAGHMLDSPTRARPRFPPEMEETVRNLISNELITKNGTIAYAAAASGSDILFLEQMLALGGEINIVLPFHIVDFKKLSVQAAGISWLERFDRLLAQATSVQIVGTYNPTTFRSTLDSCNLRLCELAKARAATENLQLFGLAVLDSTQSGHKPGGTAAMLALWQEQLISYSCIYLDRLSGRKDSIGNRRKEA